MTTGIRIKDPITSMEGTPHGCTIELDVDPFPINGYFDGFILELSNAALVRLHEEIGARLPEGVARPVKSRPVVARHSYRKRQGCTSKFYGVHKDRGMVRRLLPWKVQIRSSDAYLFMAFETEIEAAKKYNEWVIEYKLNRPLNVIE
mgnify:CR=1 FL=1